MLAAVVLEDVGVLHFASIECAINNGAIEVKETTAREEKRKKKGNHAEVRQEKSKPTHTMGERRRDADAAPRSYAAEGWGLEDGRAGGKEERDSHVTDALAATVSFSFFSSLSRPLHYCYSGDTLSARSRGTFTSLAKTSRRAKTQPPPDRAERERRTTLTHLQSRRQTEGREESYQLHHVVQAVTRARACACVGVSVCMCMRVGHRAHAPDQQSPPPFSTKR